VESVVSDHALGAALAVRHLVSLGHRKLGLVTSRQSPTSPHVRRGWLEAVAECGFAPETTVDTSVPSPRAPEWEAVLDETLDQCLRNGTTALLVHADAEAMAIVQRCEARGLSVPGGLSVVAYDDEVAGLFSPALTAAPPVHRPRRRPAPRRPPRRTRATCPPGGDQSLAADTGLVRAAAARGLNDRLGSGGCGGGPAGGPGHGRARLAVDADSEPDCPSWVAVSWPAQQTVGQLRRPAYQHWLTAVERSKGRGERPVRRTASLGWSPPTNAKDLQR